MKFTHFLVIMAAIAGVQSACKNFTTCRDCIANRCIWYKSASGEFCDTSKIVRFSYVLKIRSSTLCAKSDGIISSSSTMIPIEIVNTQKIIVSDATTKRSIVQDQSTTKVEVNILTDSVTQSANPIHRSTTTDTPTENQSDLEHGPQLLPAERTGANKLVNRNDEKDIGSEVRRHECHMFASIRKLRRLQLSRPFTDKQYRHAVQQCLKALSQP